MTNPTTTENGNGYRVVTNGEWYKAQRWIKIFWKFGFWDDIHSERAIDWYYFYSQEEAEELADQAKEDDIMKNSKYSPL